MAKILVIEDEKDLRELYVEILQDAGHEVTAAADGEAGLLKLIEGGWDLVLLDIVLPRYDGMAVLELLKKKTAFKANGPIILLTALSQETLVQKGLSLGAVGYLVKSEVTPDQVVENVRNFLTKG